MDSSTKKLLSGSMVYFVGNALTQLISLLLMRFVTGNITPEEYGYFNLVATVSNLVIPFVTLQIADAVFKFVLKAEDDRQRKAYFTICFAVCLASVALIVVVMLQSGKESGLSSVVAGGSGRDSYLSKSKHGSKDKIMASATKWIALVFVVLALVLNVLNTFPTSAA